MRYLHEINFKLRRFFRIIVINIDNYCALFNPALKTETVSFS